MRQSSLKPILFAAAAGLAVSACSAVDRINDIGKPPDLSPIADPGAAKPVTLPMAPQEPAATHQTNSLWTVGARSFFHDPRAGHVGDLLTVNISIADAAKLSDTTTRNRDNAESAGLSNFFGLETKIPAALGADPTKLVNTNSTTSNSGSGSVDRSETINLTLAAIVTQVMANGNMVIRGHQEVLVNNELRNLQISGIVRSEDITSSNTIDLAQIAEARLSYGGKGQITDVQQPRYGEQLFDVLMPF